MKGVCRFFGVIVAIVFVCFSPFLNAKSLKFTTFADAGTSLVTEKIMREVYQRLGYSLIIQEYPAARSLHLSNMGRYDGELGRLSIVQKKYPNLVMVPTPILELKQIVFTKNKDFVPSDWESLQPYTAVSLIGYKYTEDKLISNGIHHGLVSTFSQVIKLVDVGRFDLAVLANLDGLKAMRDSKVYLKALEPEVDRFSIYHFIHKKHRHLIPLIDKTIKTLKSEGYIDKVEREVIESLSKP